MEGFWGRIARRLKVGVTASGHYDRPSPDQAARPIMWVFAFVGQERHNIGHPKADQLPQRPSRACNVACRESSRNCCLAR